MSRQQTTRSCNMASTFPDTRNPRANAAKAWVGHAEQRHYHHAPLAVLFVRGGSCATACGTSAYSSRFTLVVRRLPGNGAKGIGETESPGSRARSQHLTTRRLTPVHHAASRPSNRPRIGSGCSAYMTLDSTYLRCPPVSCNFRAPSATQLALHHRGLDQQLPLCTARATRRECTRITGPNASSLPGLASIMQKWTR
jgi:hypothetical protein